MSDAPEKLRRIWFVGFAGHRQVEDPVGAKAAIARELEVIRQTVPGELAGVSSVAAGTDILFLDACAEAGMKTIVLLPFAKERFSQDFDNPTEWEHACRCIDAAWWSEVSPGGEEAPAAYHVVARESLEVADRMLFFWDGKPARGLGGTAETVAETIEREIPARVIDSHNFAAKWMGKEPNSIERDRMFDDLPPSTDVPNLFEKLDARANAGAPRSRWFAAGSMSLNQLATILQAVLVTFALAAEEAGAMVRLIIISIAAALPWIGGRLRWQEQWIRDRMRAELLRSLLTCHEPGSPLRPPAIELFGREEAFLRTVAMHLVPLRKGWQLTRDEYLNERVNGQIRYLQGKGDLAAKRMAIFGRLFWIASWTAIALGSFGVIAAFFHIKMADFMGKPLSFTAAVMPVIAAWCLAMISVFEFKRRASLYRQLVSELARLKPKLANASCPSEVSRAMNQVERLLLNELWEWQSTRKK
ncbi:MAG: hypothetical protein H8M99_04465 [Gloeobacteraceae cyanobacterium ES-bin-144]|nr:hypothetical protein [Verrucomicrobiales bacterium]